MSQTHKGKTVHPTFLGVRVNKLKHWDLLQHYQDRGYILLGLSVDLLDSGFHVFGGCRHMFGVDEEHL